MKIKNILYAILFILLVVVVLVSALFCAVAAIGLPVILSIAYTWWWMLSYLCYGVVLYVVYHILKSTNDDK
jgi:hypothetical protein